MTSVDVEAANRWATAFRRISNVEILDSETISIARVHGLGHRLPVTRQVPRRVALGLIELGYPTTRRPNPREG